MSLCLIQALAFAQQSPSSAAPAQLRAPAAEGSLNPPAQVFQPPAEVAVSRGSEPSVSRPYVPPPESTTPSVSTPVSRQEPVQRSSSSASSSTPDILSAATDVPGGAPAWVAELQVQCSGISCHLAAASVQDLSDRIRSQMALCAACHHFHLANETHDLSTRMISGLTHALTRVHVAS